MPRFITKNWVKVHDQSGNAKDRYKLSKQIRLKTSVLRSDLFDFSHGYIVVKGTITVKGNDKTEWKNRLLEFKNNTPFTNCISKINNVLINNAEDLYVVMPVYNLLQYSKNYSKTTRSLWNYYRDEVSDDINDSNGLNKKIINSKCFKYKASITGSTIYYNVAVKVTSAYGNEVDNPEYDANKIGTKKVEIAVSLKYLSSFWRTLNMPLINCEVSLTLTWSENCVINSMEKRVTTGIKKDNSPTNATFQITDKIVRPNCYFIDWKWQNTLGTTKNRI